MRTMKLSTPMLSLYGYFFGLAEAAKEDFDFRSFHVDMSEDFSKMINKVKETELPEEYQFPEISPSFGLDPGFLKSLKEQWTTSFDWEKEQAAINAFNHFKVKIEGLDIHFVHEPSKTPDAIPLILLHGWPDTFMEFSPIIDELQKEARTATGKPVAFDVVVPSLPGFAFSDVPPANWTVDDTGRVFNTLMTDVLGYEHYAVHGTDWGVAVAYSMYDNFNSSVCAAHFNFLPFFPLTPDQLAAENITLSPIETFEEQRFLEWNTAGIGYFIEQTNKPSTIGLALYDNPIGQLAWIAEDYVIWSDPRAGTPPSVLTHERILLNVSLYYLTRSIISSVYIYAQNPNGFATEYTKARTNAPLIYSSFRYNIGFWPPKLVEKVANLVLYRTHEFGGHFPALDNPPALINDLREIGSYW